ARLTQPRAERVATIRRLVAVAEELVGERRVEILRLEQLVELRCRQLAPLEIGDRLDALRELDLEAAWEGEPVPGLAEGGYAALPRLRVDADDRLVRATDVLGVDRQVRDVPLLRAGALPRVHSLLDRVLVRSRERGVDELADPRVARVHGQLVALLDDPPRVV